jgi:Zn-dependent protease with chaperone function
MRRLAVSTVLQICLGLAMGPAASVAQTDTAAPAPAAISVGAPAADTAAARDYLAEARAAFTPENREYQRIRVALAVVSPLLGILVGLALLFTGLAQRMRNVAMAGGSRRWRRVLVFFTLYSLAMFVILFPLTWYETYALELRFGFMTQSLAGWFVDQLKALAFQIVAVGVVPLLAIAWFAVEWSPRRWWLLLASGTLPVLVASVLLQPLVFDPLFNEFTPLHDEQLRTEILALGARADVPARNVYEVDMSNRTKKVNAYVSGFGASQRIVLWDTMLEAMRKDEILFVMGHEMGHYVLMHIWRGVLWSSLAAIGVFWLVAQLANGALRLWGARWGVTSVADLAAMPLLIAVLSLVSYVGAPISNVVSRAIEHESDVYALELTHDNDAGARAFLKLARGNRSDPEPAAWVKWFLYTHPPLGERIRFAQSYRPWEKGEPNRQYRGR